MKEGPHLLSGAGLFVSILLLQKHIKRVPDVVVFLKPLFQIGVFGAADIGDQHVDNAQRRYKGIEEGRHFGAAQQIIVRPGNQRGEERICD